ncbi:MAG: DnaD domain protein, partial [Clostridia bacterium]|nr:DnaD domain protein [Clostridia bacterium]
MSYNINPAAFSAAFLVPTSVAQKIKIANEKQLKVILYILANLSGGIDAKKISEECGIELSQVEDALLFWQQCELLQGQKEIEKKDEPQPKRIAARDERPSRVDVARRGLEDKNLNMLLNEAQFKFGRNLKTNEAAALVWIYDDLGLDISVILLLLQYALSEKRLNITFLEKTAVKWV